MTAVEHDHLKSVLLFQEVDPGLGDGVADKYFHLILVGQFVGAGNIIVM
ncbi:hypothetical protein OAA59_02400 [bacterium]|nr:hypothetical protein [bacterium]